MRSTTHTRSAYLGLGLLIAVALLFISPAAAGAAYSVNLSSFGALCDGRHNDKAALEAAIAAVHNHGGGVIMVPAGNCRIVQSHSSVTTGIDGPLTIKGVSRSSTLSLDTDVAGAYRALFRIAGPNVVLDTLRLVRASNLFGVMIDVYGATEFRMKNVVIDGQENTIGGRDFDAIALSARSGTTISAALLSSVTIKNATFGLFQANGTTGTVNGFTVDHSIFTGNDGDDLEFNAPSSTMKNITVTHSTFRDNTYTDPSAGAGFGVGLAHVQTAQVRDNIFSGYTYEPVHIEDRSSHITVDHNQFSHAFTAPLDYASMVFIIDGSHDITVTHNTFDTAANTNNIACIYAGQGGGKVVPTDITITGNTFKRRPNAIALANYGATHVVIQHNTTITIP